MVKEGNIKKYLGGAINAVRDNPWLSTLALTPLAYYGAGKSQKSLVRAATRFTMPNASQREINAIVNSTKSSIPFKTAAAYAMALLVNPKVPGGKTLRVLLKPRISYTSPLDKTAAANNLFEVPIVPISSSVNIIQDDNYLNRPQKDLIQNIIYGSENKLYGMTSPKNLANGAIKAGAAAGTAIIFGDIAGKIFGVPPQLTRRLSNIGAVASAIKSTGIFG